MNLKNKKIAFLGDSITEGVGAKNLHGYVDYFFELTGADCKNFGISGTRLARQKTPTVDNPSYDLDFCTRAREITGDFDYFVVFGGTNDFGHGDADFGTFADRTPDTFCGAVHTLFETLTKMHPESEIVVITPICRTDDDEIAAIKGRNLEAYVSVIKEAAKLYKLPVLNLFKSEQPPYNPIIDASLLADGLHPNDEGHKVIAEHIIDFLNTI